MLHGDGIHDDTLALQELLDNVYQTLGEGATAPLWENQGKIKILIERDFDTEAPLR